MDLWPTLSDSHSAQECARAAAGVCFFVTAVTGISAIIAIGTGHTVLGLDGWGLVDAALFCALGVGIWKLSRVAAVLALVLYSLELAYKVSENGHPGNPFLIILFLFGLTNGIRGTFAYKRFTPSPVIAIGPTANPSANRATIWKRRIIFALGSIACIAVSVVFFVWATYSYQNRTTEPKTWPRIAISGPGINADLITQWRDGVRYQFRAAPMSPELAISFDNEVRNNPGGQKFWVVFDDRSGFVLCRDQLEVGREIDSENKVSALIGNGFIAGCRASDYRNAANVRIEFLFPKLTPVNDVDLTKGLLSVPVEDLKQPSRKTEKEATTEEDKLTGFDYFSGKMETVSGHTFVLDRQGERGAAISWLEGSTLSFRCKRGKECLVENVTAGTSVHGTMLR